MCLKILRSDLDNWQREFGVGVVIYLQKNRQTKTMINFRGKKVQKRKSNCNILYVYVKNKVLCNSNNGILI